ncbi:MAG TPA: TetR/AcrR family transcriptional regulator [Acidimicrobiales bacterium]|nr:TetR/AcrR family transcriptional regulator [Acidimicrobiales bacterium]
MTYAPGTAGTPAAAHRRTRSRRGQGEQLRDEILAAAERILIETNDQSALSIRAIANAVGVTPPSIYLHFADRNDLVFAVCERHAEQLEQAMMDAAEGIGDPWERIRRRGRAYLQWGLENPEHYRILMMSRPDQTPDRFIDERLADTAGLMPVADDVAEAIASRQVTPGEEPIEMAKMLWMMIHGTVALLISKPDFPFGSVDEVYERLFELVHRGLAPRPGS